MKTVVVQYETLPDRADENEKLVEAVYAELRERAPQHFGYATFRLDDDVTFVHVLIEHGDGDLSLADLPAFQAFVGGVEERCAIPPRARGAKVVGAHNFSAR